MGGRGSWSLGGGVWHGYVWRGYGIDGCTSMGMAWERAGGYLEVGNEGNGQPIECCPQSEGRGMPSLFEHCVCEEAITLVHSYFDCAPSPSFKQCVIHHSILPAPSNPPFTIMQPSPVLHLHPPHHHHHSNLHKPNNPEASQGIFPQTPPPLRSTLTYKLSARRCAASFSRIVAATYLNPAAAPAPRARAATVMVRAAGVARVL